MERHYYFDRNLLALSIRHSPLCERLTAAETTLGRYRFIEGKNNESIPAWVDKSSTARLLHSLVAPKREAEKLIAAGQNEGYIVILGLGGGFPAEAALERENTQKVVVIDYDINSIAELLCSRDYITLFNDHRFTLLIDPYDYEIEQYITDNYHPSLYKGIRVIPLRARCEFDQEHFLTATNAVRRAIDSISSDYSVQAYFGKRWFANIVRNLFRAEHQCGVIAPITNAAVCAAGPSLDIQMEHLKQRRKELFVIATDTALGTFVAAKICPDAVISIDCQHISYLHFMSSNKQFDMSHVMLFLDLASPPMLASTAPNTFFFSGGHPLVRYTNLFFKEFPVIDTSGANVTYAAVSLAEKLGAKKIELYGADFAYPNGMTYTKGAYFYPYFDRRQNRFIPTSAQLANFLFKIPSITKISLPSSLSEKKAGNYYYETRSLAMYRKKLEEKAQDSQAVLEAVPGLGAPLNFMRQPMRHKGNNTIKLFAIGSAQMSAKNFLLDYRRKIEMLPIPMSHDETYIENYKNKLLPFEKIIWTTLLPSIAAINKRETLKNFPELLHAVKMECIREIDRAINI